MNDGAWKRRIIEMVRDWPSYTCPVCDEYEPAWYYQLPTKGGLCETCWKAANKEKIVNTH